MTAPLHLAVALDGTGAPAFTPGYWVDLVREAERGLLDFVTVDDSFAARPDRPDAVLTAARVAPLTRHVGLVPAATVTYTEPFHLSKAIATLDYVSGGRAGWQVRVSGDPAEAAHFGRRAVTPGDPDLLDEAADYVEVVRRLWDSWEDGAEIRDAASGRFIDRDRLHYIDFEGRWFRVKGPSIVPRPPQGQPLVTVAATDEPGYRLAGRAADLVFVTPQDAASARATVARVRAAQAGAGRADQTVHVFADLPAGTPADRLLAWQAAGITGYRLRGDLATVTRGLVPELQARGAFRRGYPPGTSLRGLLGLPRPASRYARGSA